MLESFQFYLTANKSIKTTEVLELDLYLVVWVFLPCSGIVFDSCWCGIHTLPYTQNGSIRCHFWAWPPPTGDSCALTQAAANRLRPVSWGQNVGRRQVRCHHSNRWYTHGACRLTCQSMCFIGKSHLISDVFCWRHRQDAKWHWLYLLLEKSLMVYLLGEPELLGEGCGKWRTVSCAASWRWKTQFPEDIASQMSCLQVDPCQHAPTLVRSDCEIWEMARWGRIGGSCRGSFPAQAGISGGLLQCSLGVRGPNTPLACTGTTSSQFPQMQWGFFRCTSKREGNVACPFLQISVDLACQTQRELCH